MLKPLKLKPNTFFLADPHFMHDVPFIWEKRGFQGVLDHARGVMDSINTIVKPEDNLIIIGDFSLNSSIEETKELFRQIKCQNVYKIWGNHISFTSKIYKEALPFPSGDFIPEVYPLKWENVTFLGHYAEFLINKKRYICQHFPLSIWNHYQYNARHVCGHSHGSFEETRPEWKKGKKLDVGWDIFRRPISFDEVEDIMRTKEFVRLDHHDQSKT